MLFDRERKLTQDKNCENDFILFTKVFVCLLPCLFVCWRYPVEVEHFYITLISKEVC